MQKAGGVYDEPQFAKRRHARHSARDAVFIRKIKRGFATSAQRHNLSETTTGAQMLHERRANAAAGAKDHGDAALRERRHMHRRKLVHDFSFPKAFDR